MTWEFDKSNVQELRFIFKSCVSFCADGIPIRTRLSFHPRWKPSQPFFASLPRSPVWTSLACGMCIHATSQIHTDRHTNQKSDSLVSIRAGKRMDKSCRLFHTWSRPTRLVRPFRSREPGTCRGNRSVPNVRHNADGLLDIRCIRARTILHRTAPVWVSARPRLHPPKSDIRWSR